MAQFTQSQSSAMVIIESEELLQYISPALLKVDFDDSHVKIISVAGSAIFFFILLFASIVMFSIFGAFRSLPLKHRVFLSLAVIRAVFGVVCIAVGTHAIFATSNMTRDVVKGKTATGTLSMCVTVGFFLFEVSTVVVSDIVFKTFSKLLLTHHGLAALTYGLCLYHEIGFGIGCKVLTLEMSTPFTCFCYVLMKIGMERSLLWKVNQLIMIHTFHLRSMVECHIWYLTYKHWHEIWNGFPFFIFFLIYLGAVLVTFIMTPYWGYKKTQQLFNPVDWNFVESQTSDSVPNGTTKKVQ